MNHVFIKPEKALEIIRIAMAATLRSRILLYDRDESDNRRRIYKRAKEVFWNNPDYPSPTPAIHRRFPTDHRVKE